MKTYLLFAVLAGAVLAAMSFAQEPFEEHERMLEERERLLEERERMFEEHEVGRHEGTPEEAMEREMHTLNMQMELNERRSLAEVGERMRQLELKREHMAIQQQEAEMDFNQQMREIELEKHRLALSNKQQHKKHQARAGHCGDGVMPLVLVICCIVNILVAVWIYQDIRKRNAGSGLWIVIALLTGLFGALVYAVVRVGDRQTQP